ncbi:MAG: response regulator transcription factor [Deltaproteobacteria bacterium]|nr:response regulator transcription factor [Deltaproteobacteria bacterium]
MTASAKPIRALVVEDERPARNYLVELLLAAGQVEVTAAVATLEEAREALGPGGVTVDVAFVDVQLAGPAPDETGLALVRALAGTPGAPLFVLATAHEQHAVEAYALGVIDYLLKPFSRERVEQCLGRVGARPTEGRPPSSEQRVVARRGNGLVFLAMREVLCFEAAERLTFVHTPHGRLDVDLSLSAIEASMGRWLLRVHRNWLVSLDRVKALEREDGESLLVVGGLGDSGADVRVPVARDRAHSVREVLLADASGIRRP